MAAQETVLEDEEIDCDEKCVGENDLKKLRDSHFKAGVREGIPAGTQSSLQDGFNCGYKEAFFVSYNFGKIRGILNGLSSYVTLENKETDSKNEKFKDRIDQLISQLDKIEEHHWKITYDAASETTLKSESTVAKDTGTTKEHRLTMNGSSEFRELLTQCKHLCDELHLDPDIPNI